MSTRELHIKNIYPLEIPGVDAEKREQSGITDQETEVEGKVKGKGMERTWSLRVCVEEALTHHVRQQGLHAAKQNSCLITIDQGGGVCRNLPLRGKLCKFL